MSSSTGVPLASVSLSRAWVCPAVSTGLMVSILDGHAERDSGPALMREGDQHPGHPSIFRPELGVSLQDQVRRSGRESLHADVVVSEASDASQRLDAGLASGPPGRVALRRSSLPLAVRHLWGREYALPKPGTPLEQATHAIHLHHVHTDADDPHVGSRLLHRYGFCEVTGLIDVAAAELGDAVREKL